MTTVTSFFRHIPECFLPTYSSILIALAVSGIGAGEFVVAMLPLVAVLFLIGYVFYLRKLPKATGRAPKGGRIESVKMRRSDPCSVPPLSPLLFLIPF